jgi:hypothetical protein
LLCSRSNLPLLPEGFSLTTFAFDIPKSNVSSDKWFRIAGNRRTGQCSCCERTPNTQPVWAIGKEPDPYASTSMSVHHSHTVLTPPILLSRLSTTGLMTSSKPTTLKTTVSSLQFACQYRNLLPFHIANEFVYVSGRMTRWLDYSRHQWWPSKAQRDSAQPPCKMEPSGRSEERSIVSAIRLCYSNKGRAGRERRIP